jgi:LmbE family N-acetylglucosaminyl deacetylase
MEAVHRILGVERLLFWHYPDQGLSEALDSEVRLETTLKELEPDILYVPSAWDRHPDHVATARLVDTAASYVRQIIRIYEVFCPLSPKLVNCCIDISGTYDVKRRATQAFVSQHVSFSSALLLNRVQSELAHQSTVRAVEAFLELPPAHYGYVCHLLANARQSPSQVLNYRNVARAYLTNLFFSGSIAEQIRKR